MSLARHLIPSTALLLTLTACGGASAGRGGDGTGTDDGEPLQCAGTLRQRGASIIAGQPDSGAPAVVAVNSARAVCNRAGAPLCSGTLIQPGLVLTAGHCLGDDLAVLFGGNAEAGMGPIGEGVEDSFFPVTGMIAHPGFDPETGAHDVALLRLNRPSDVPPVPLLEVALDETWAGRQVRVVGFGISREGVPGEKRMGTVVISAVNDGEFTYRAAPSMTCTGDSGGPVLATIDGREYVIGVTSHGDRDCNEYGVAMQVNTIYADLLGAP